MPGLQDTRRGILQTQINRCTSNVTPSSAFAEYDDTLCHCEERLFRSTRRRKRTKQSILSLRGEMDCFASLAMTVSKNPSACIRPVIARSEATKQSILPLCGKMDCLGEPV